MEKIIVTDADGVLLNWEYAFCVWMDAQGYTQIPDGNKEYNLGIRYGVSGNKAADKVREFNASAAMGFLPALRDARYYVKRLHEEHGYNFHCVTSLGLDPSAKKLRQMNLDKLFGDTAFTVLDLDGDAILPNGELIDTVTLVSDQELDVSTDADVGTYADNISVTPTSTNDPTITGSENFNQENYTFSYDTGDLTINRRTITLTASNQEKIYGDLLDLGDTVFIALDLDGDAILPNGEVVTNVTVNSATGVDSSTTSDVATYTDEIVISGPVAGSDGTGDGFLESNYDIFYVAGDLTVNRRAAQIIASVQEKDYGDVHDLGDTAFTVVDRDGGALPNGETVNTVTLVSENGIDASTDADVGT